ncbi:hypothetical protein DFJ77DRAFT_471131 [Powellomyces hirtus]|nr:hypothetical protein DFJ77DRAFT_471131 [Powellomyces hirtus]
MANLSQNSETANRACPRAGHTNSSFKSTQAAIEQHRQYRAALERNLIHLAEERASSVEPGLVAAWCQARNSTQKYGFIEPVQSARILAGSEPIPEHLRSKPRLVFIVQIPETAGKGAASECGTCSAAAKYRFVSWRNDDPKAVYFCESPSIGNQAVTKERQQVEGTSLGSLTGGDAAGSIVEHKTLMGQALRCDLDLLAASEKFVESELTQASSIIPQPNDESTFFRNFVEAATAVPYRPAQPHTADTSEQSCSLTNDRHRASDLSSVPSSGKKRVSANMSVEEKEAALSGDYPGKQLLATLLNTAQDELGSGDDKLDVAMVIEKANASVQTLLAALMHELRTPLNGILGIIDLMQAEDSYEKQQLYIDGLEQSSSTLLSVTTRLEDLWTLQGHDPVIDLPLDLSVTAQNVSEAVKHYAPQNEHARSIEIDIDSDCLLAMTGDQTKLQQTLSNLVLAAVTSNNARRAKLGIQLMNKTADHAIVRLAITSGGSEVSQSDIDKDSFSFDDLASMEEMHSMPVAIAIASQLISKLGGQLKVTLKGGFLSFVFYLTFGLAREAVTTQSQKTSKLDGRPPRILIVDDNKVNRLVLQKMLAKLGYAADEAEDGIFALPLIERTAYDVVFLDLDMPQMDGFETCRNIRKDKKNDSVVVIALTSNSTSQAKRQSVDAGMQDFFTKPVTVKAVRDMLEKWEIIREPLPPLASRR